MKVLFFKVQYLKNACVFILLPVAFFPFILPRMYLLMIMSSLITVGMAYGMNFLVGYTGLFSFGQGFFIGLTVYTGACLYISGFPLIPGMLLGILVNIPLTILLGRMLFRLGGSYFVLGTLALVELGYITITDLRIAKGSEGIILPIIGNDLIYYYLLLALCVGVVFLTNKLSSTKTGIALLSIREDEVAASVMGINTVKYKTIAWIISNLIMASFGCVSTVRTAYIMPQNVFSVPLSLYALIAILVGGIGTTIGPLLGAVICELFSYFVFVNIQFALLATYGIILILVKLLLPRGIWPYLRKYVMHKT